MKIVLKNKGTLDCGNVSLTLDRQNHLLGFDRMALSRSASFTLPRTANNVEVLGCPDVHSFGEGERVRYAAQVQADSVTIDGFLYITAVAADSFAVVFVFGELLDLARIKDVKVANLIARGTHTYRYNTNVRNANLTNLPAFANVRYLLAGSQTEYLPSWQMAAVISEAVEAAGLTHSFTADKTRVIVGKPTAEASLSINMQSMLDDNPNSLLVQGSGFDVEAFITDAEPVDVDDYTEELHQDYAHPDYYDTVERTIDYTWQIAALHANVPLAITFPAAFTPSGLKMSHVEGGERKQTIVTGETINIDENSDFWFLIGEEERTVVETGQTFYGNTLTAEKVVHTFAPEDSEFNTSATLQVKTELANGATMDLKDNVSGSLLDLLRDFAVIKGGVLDYNDTDGFFANPLDFDSWSEKVLSDIIAFKQSERKVDGWQRDNIIEFNGDGVPDSERVRQVYTVGNQNLEQSNTLRTLPYSEGVEQPSGSDSVLRVVSDGDTVAFCSGSVNMKRRRIPRNTGLERLAEQSTTLRYNVRMPLLTFMSITADTVLIIEGVRCIWSQMQWSAGVAEIHLMKI